jgi:hypothetical protein
VNDSEPDVQRSRQDQSPLQAAAAEVNAGLVRFAADVISTPVAAAAGELEINLHAAACGHHNKTLTRAGKDQASEKRYTTLEGL